MRGSGLRLVMAGAFRSVVRGSREVVAAAGALIPVAAGPAAQPMSGLAPPREPLISLYRVNGGAFLRCWYTPWDSNPEPAD